MIASGFPKNLRVLLALSGAGLCGGCSSMDNIIPPMLNARPAAVATAQQGGPADSEKIVRLPMGPQDLDCPKVEVQDSGASLRVGGADNASVRYQFDIAQTARECDPQGANFSLKVGVSGHLVIGPAGSPGAYSAPLRITVLSGVAQKPTYSKTFKVEANTADAAQTTFDFVSEPIILPLTRTDLADDYSIVIGFDTGHAQAPAHPRKRHHAHANDAH